MNVADKDKVTAVAVTEGTSSKKSSKKEVSENQTSLLDD